MHLVVSWHRLIVEVSADQAFVDCYCCIAIDFFLMVVVYRNDQATIRPREWAAGVAVYNCVLGIAQACTSVVTASATGSLRGGMSI